MTKVFVPQDFEKTNKFSNELAEYLKRKNACYLWISNPWEPYTAWNCASLYRTGNICIGRYRLCFGSVLSKSDTEVVFSGSFYCGEEKLGCQSFSLDLTSPDGVLTFSFCSDGDVLRKLGVNIQYLMPWDKPIEQEEIQEEELWGEQGESQSCHSLSILSSQPFSYWGKAAFRARLSLCQITNPHVSYILLPKEELACHFLTVDKEEAVCIPENGASLVFERTARQCYQEGKKESLGAWDYYLSVQGDFHCESKGIVMGLHGGEYVKHDNSLRFVSGQDALLLDKDISYEGSQRATTAWLRVQGLYYSSPSSSLLYKMQNGALHPYHPLAAAYEEYSPPFPYMPWKNTILESKEEGIRGENLLYEKRYKSLFQNPLNHMSKIHSANKASIDIKSAAQAIGDNLVNSADYRNNSEVAIAANGLCVGINTDTDEWDWVGIGNISGGGLPDVRLKNITPRGRQALLNKDCLIAVFSGEEFKELWETGSISMGLDGWKIEFLTEQWSKKDNKIFLVKYTKNVSIREKLCGNEVFDRVIKSAYEGDQKIRRGYERLMKIIDDREFQGVLMINGVAKAPDNSPEVSIMISSIKQLPAAYIMMENGKAFVEDGRIKTEASAVSSFVHYEKALEQEMETPMAEDKGKLETVEVSVIFQNSKVVDFYSKSELHIQKILGESIGNSCIVINGVYEKVSGQGSYRFFPASEVEWTIGGSIVNRIAMKNMQIHAESGCSAFSVSGTLEFENCPKGDLFSLEQLWFEELFWRLDQENFVTEDASLVKIQAGNCIVREKSFACQFGAYPEKLMIGRTGSPDDIGYRSITAPVDQAVPEGKWNGILWNIQAGTRGKLGGELPVSIQLIMAWTGKSVYVGVREKDLDAISVSGILGIGFGGMEISKSQEQQNFQIKMCNIGVKFLNFTVPPKSADLYIIGEKGKLGWYMSYNTLDKEDK